MNTNSDRFVMERRDPPPPSRAGRPNKYLPMLTKMRKRTPPGKWVHITHYESETGARDAKKRIRSGDMQIPAGLWEVRAVKNQDGTSDLYMRWFEQKDGRT